MRRGFVGSLVGLALLGGTGCIMHAESPAYALYPPPRRGHDDVALLLGPVATVDGAAVPPSRSTFELLPGCHVVTTQTRLLAFDPSTGNNPQGEVTGTLPEVTYAIDMRAGHTYVIEREVQQVGGNSANIEMSARDVAPDGQAGALSPARKVAEIVACRSRHP